MTLQKTGHVSKTDQKTRWNVNKEAKVTSTGKYWSHVARDRILSSPYVHIWAYLHSCQPWGKMFKGPTKPNWTFWPWFYKVPLAQKEDCSSSKQHHTHNRAARLIVKRSRSRFKHSRDLISKWQRFVCLLNLWQSHIWYSNLCSRCHWQRTHVMFGYKIFSTAQHYFCLTIIHIITEALI